MHNVNYVNSIGTKIPMVTLVSECQVARHNKFTHLIIAPGENGEEILIPIKASKTKSFLKQAKKIIPTGKTFRTLNLLSNFEAMISSWHPEAKTFTCEG